MNRESAASRSSGTCDALEFSTEGGVSGSRAFQSCLLRPGLALTISRSTPEDPLRASFDMDDAPIQFGFTYSGRNRCVYSSGCLRNQTHEMQAGSNGIFHLPKTHGFLEQPGGASNCIMGIIVAPELLYDYFADSMDQLPVEFQRKLEGRLDTPMAWFGPCNPAKHCLLTQILNCPYTGGMRKMFLESRVMELLAMQLQDYIESQTHRKATSHALCPADVERIRHASEILTSDLENPPNLPELAARVGINEKKLKTGFRQVYASSVFGYFREHRLQKAHELLQEGNLNVTEAAYAVGYQSLSHFSQAFKERFGILPKDFLTNQRRLLVS
ncbi:helix-turn-helix transcriptional regulator [Salidesulfovibrio onnuriiensis]|uniref:helix-turn-helix transcriptional regulator n=1 Tax=Salidesulfovibrio onnuriiensis TaxID=2583823 RepID=UPI0011C8F42B|nr:AraC family transcriptional regulator [Salidesulfovibrio onnuriiensis]